jgi:hypothetical protein
VEDGPRAGPAGSRILRLHRNDGTGHWSPLDPPSWADLPDTAPDATAVAAADLDGDRLPEVLLLRPGRLWVSANPGAATFGPFAEAWAWDGPTTPAFSSLTLGDVDGDGDLDIAITTTFATWVSGGPGHGDPGGELTPAGPQLLLCGEGGGFVLDRVLPVASGAMYAQIAGFTDRDADGDMDLYIPAEFGGLPGATPSAFFRNDGPGDDGATLLVDDAPALEFDYRLGAMGLVSFDWNDDDLLDCCVVQVGPTACGATSPTGRYVRAGAATGLGPGPSDFRSGHSLEILDLDHDGHLDAVAAGGDNQPGGPPNTDRLWRSEDDRWFVDESVAAGFFDPTDHFGLVAADLDDNGAPDVLLSGRDSSHALWMAPCTAGHFVELEFQGREGNREGWGAQVRLDAGEGGS